MFANIIPIYSEYLCLFLQCDRVLDWMKVIAPLSLSEMD